MKGAELSTPSENNLKASVKVILALSLVHFTGDFYSSFTSPLFPLFVQKLNLSLVQIGIIAGLSRFLAFIVQPSVGYLADRYQTRWFVLGGLLLPVMFIPLSGIAPSFMILLSCIAIGSIGSAMFHPSVTGMVPSYAGRNAGLSMSIFNTGGTFSFAIGPLFITWYAARFGLEAVPATMLIGLSIAFYLYFVVPKPQSEGLRDRGFFGTLKETIGHVWKSILLIWVVMVLRSIVGQSFLTFMPVLYVSKGYPLVTGGMVYSLFSLAGAASGIISGHISDRIGFKPVFIASHALMVPALLLLLHLHGNWIYPGAFLAGFFTLATLPLGVVMAQTLAPRGRSMVASLMMGLAFGLGGIISPVIGKLADIFSIEVVLLGVSQLPLISLILIFRFPNMGRRAV